MPDLRYRAVTNTHGHRVFDDDLAIAACRDAETAERIAAAMNEMETRDGHD